MAENNQNRRYPQNLQGVLQLAMDAGSAAEGPAPVEPMSEEVNACSVYISNLRRLQADTFTHKHTLSGLLVHLS